MIVVVNLLPFLNGSNTINFRYINISFVCMRTEVKSTGIYDLIFPLIFSLKNFKLLVFTEVI